MARWGDGPRHRSAAPGGGQVSTGIAGHPRAGAVASVAGAVPAPRKAGPIAASPRVPGVLVGSRAGAHGLASATGALRAARKRATRRNGASGTGPDDATKHPEPDEGHEPAGL